MMTLRTALSSGSKAGLSLAAGLGCADLLYATCALLGIASILAEHKNYGLAIAILGGLWLAMQGASLVKGRVRPELGAPEEEDSTLLESFRKGLLLGLGNPQAIVFFSTVFVGAVAVAPEVSDKLIIIVSVAFASLFLRGSIVSLASLEKLEELFIRHRKKFDKTAGALLFLFGVKMSGTAVAAVSQSLLQ